MTTHKIKFWIIRKLAGDKPLMLNVRIEGGNIDWLRGRTHLIANRINLLRNYGELP